MNKKDKEKNKKRKRKKLTQDQIVTRISGIICFVVIVVMLIIVVPKSIKDISNNALGHADALTDLAKACSSTMLCDDPTSDADLTSLITVFTSADADIFTNNELDYDKYNNLASVQNFSLTANQLASFVNQILLNTANIYNLTFYQITIDSAQKQIKCVVSANFRAVTKLSTNQEEVYKKLGYSIPNTVYLSTYTDYSQEPKSDITFNALDVKKNNNAKAFFSELRSDFNIAELPYNTITNTLNTFCDKTNTTYSIKDNHLQFTNN